MAFAISGTTSRAPPAATHRRSRPASRNKHARRLIARSSRRHGSSRQRGTTITQAGATDRATLVRREKIVTPSHAAHLTASGTLANADKAIIDVDKKVNGYFLNPQHGAGVHKARVFKSVLGYGAENYQGLIDQIREGVRQQRATPGKADKYGETFAVDIPVMGPKGTATVRTGWIYDPGSEIPRLLTALVKK